MNWQIASVNEGNKPIKCDNCDAKSVQKLSNEHINAVHDGKKPFKCEICAASYINRTGLRQHNSSIHEKKNIKLYQMSGVKVAGGQDGQLPTHVLTNTCPKFLHKISPNIR